MLRQNQLNVKLTDKEMEYLRKYAQSQYTTISAVVRKMVFLGIERVKNETTDDNIYR